MLCDRQCVRSWRQEGTFRMGTAFGSLSVRIWGRKHEVIIQWVLRGWEAWIVLGKLGGHTERGCLHLCSMENRVMELDDRLPESERKTSRPSSGKNHIPNTRQGSGGSFLESLVLRSTCIYKSSLHAGVCFCSRASQGHLQESKELEK